MKRFILLLIVDGAVLGAVAFFVAAPALISGLDRSGSAQTGLVPGSAESACVQADDAEGADLADVGSVGGDFSGFSLMGAP